MAVVKHFEREVEKLVSRRKFCLIGSADGEGIPNIKAMLAPRKALGIKTYYFSTNTSSEHVRQYRENPKASVYFYKTFLSYKGVLLKGTMEVLVDKEVKEMLWENGDEKYYPGGVNDPDYCVLRFTAERGRFYHKMESQNFVVENDSTQLEGTAGATEQADA